MIVVDALSSLPMFRDFDKKALEPLADMVALKFFDEGSIIFNKGDEGENMYFIQGGRVDVIWDISAHRKFILTSIESGDFFGEMAILENTTRSATVMAVESLDTLALSRGDFYQLVSFQPSTGLSLIKAIGRKLSGRLRLLNEHLLFTEATLKMLDDQNKAQGAQDMSKNSDALMSQNIDDKTFEFLKSCGEQRTMKEDSVIISEGGIHREFFVLLNGAVEVSKRLPAGDRVVLALLGPGNLFGEMAFIDSEFRSAEVRTCSPVELCVFRDEHINELCQKDLGLVCNIYLAILRKISLDIRFTNKHYIESKRRLLGVHTT